MFSERGRHDVSHRLHGTVCRQVRFDGRPFPCGHDLLRRDDIREEEL